MSRSATVFLIWTAGLFLLAGPDSGCGAYVYEKKGGGLAYHAC